MTHLQTFPLPIRVLLAAGLVLSSLHGGIITAQDVPWLEEVAITESSGTTSTPAPKDPNLAPLPKISSLEEQGAFREKTLKEWSEFLGAFPLPKDRTPPQIEVLDTQKTEDGLVRRLVRYETEPGQQVEAYILAKEDLPRLSPAMVVFHSTFKHSIHQCVGITGPKASGPISEHDFRKAYALHLARRGFVTLSPRNYLWNDNETMDLKGATARYLKRNPSRKGMARMLYDAIRAVDLLETLEGVDKDRIGAVGHSLGAKEVLYLAAFDPRIKASVSSEGGIGIAQTNWDADWYLSKEGIDPSFRMNHHQLVATIAPRPFLVIGGNASDGVDTIPYLLPALPSYRLFGTPVRLGLFNHGEGHTLTESSLERTLEWLETYLAAP